MSKALGPRIIVALDFAREEEAYALVDQLSPNRCRLKIGLQMFVHFGPSFVASLIARGFEIFLDLKFHDIPETVAKAYRAAVELGVWMVNVHLLGGQTMLEAVKREQARLNTSNPPLLIGVTLLTSLSDDDLPAVGLTGSVVSNVERLASLAKESGLDGVVCSAQEACLLRSQVGEDFLLVTPGIRFEEDAKHDQKRVVTPVDAVKMGANYLVIGRSITQAPNPQAVLARIEGLIATL